MMHSHTNLNHILIKSLWNLLKQGIEQFTLRSINLLILIGIRRNCLRGGKGRLLHISTRKVINAASSMSCTDTSGMCDNMAATTHTHRLEKLNTPDKQLVTVSMLQFVY